MQNKKILKYTVLVLAFVIPGFVFFFLKKFGKNEFEVTPLYQDRPPVQVADCPPLDNVPYRIPETIINALGGFGSSRLVLYCFTNDEQQLNRVNETFNSDEIRWVKVVSLQDSLALWSRCYLFVSEQKPLLLVDKHRRIRGHYFNTREDVDRLLMEAAIILKKY